MVSKAVFLMDSGKGSIVFSFTFSHACFYRLSAGRDFAITPLLLKRRTKGGHQKDQASLGKADCTSHEHNRRAVALLITKRPKRWVEY